MAGASFALLEQAFWTTVTATLGLHGSYPQKVVATMHHVPTIAGRWARRPSWVETAPSYPQCFYSRQGTRLGLRLRGFLAG